MVFLLLPGEVPQRLPADGVFHPYPVRLCFPGASY